MQSNQVLILQEYLFPNNEKKAKRKLLDKDLRFLSDTLNLIKDFLGKTSRLKVLFYLYLNLEKFTSREDEQADNLSLIIKPLKK